MLGNLGANILLVILKDIETFRSPWLWLICYGILYSNIPNLWFKEFRIFAKHIKHNITKCRMLIFPSSHYIIFVPSRSVVILFVLRIWGIMCICALVKFCMCRSILYLAHLGVWWEVCLMSDGKSVLSVDTFDEKFVR